MGNFHAVGLSAGTVKDSWFETSTQFGVRILEVGEIVLLMYWIERKTEESQKEAVRATHGLNSM